MVRIEALNHAIRGLPEDRIRFHLCWGCWHGPHTTDIPMQRYCRRAMFYAAARPHGACSGSDFLNRLALPQTRPEPYGELVSGFTAYMANERGLSPRTIVTRCWYVRKFLTQLIDQGGVLDKVNVKTMDEYLSWLSNQGYTRGGIRAYAQGFESSCITRSGREPAPLGSRRPLWHLVCFGKRGFLRHPTGLTCNAYLRALTRIIPRIFVTARS